MPDTIRFLLVILILVAVNALYVAAEFATVGSRRSRVQEAAEGGDRAAGALLEILRDSRRLDTYVAACQIGIALSSLVAGAYGQAQLTPLLTPVLGGVGGPVAATVIVLVLITAAKGSLKLSESKLAMNTIRAYASPDAHVIYGTAYDDSLGEEIRVTVVATGLSRQGARRTAPPLQVLRTGTDNVPFNIPTLNNAVGVHNTAPAGMGHSQPDYGSMATPSVWRTNRTQAAARVDALSSGGMDDYEIPAFLRKQAD